MTKTYRTYTKLMLAGALAFSFAAEATNYTLAKTAKAGINTTVAQEDVAQQWQKKLLGPYNDTEALTAANITEAYNTLLDNVRAQRSNWSDNDWNQAKAVLDKLDYRKNTVESQLDLSGKAKIKAVQAEFRTLETAGDVKD